MGRGPLELTFFLRLHLDNHFGREAPAITKLQLVSHC